MKKILTFILALAVVGTGVRTAMADSLYGEGTGSIYTEKRAHRAGDVVTVMILETNQATNAASSNNQKNATMHVGAGMGFLGTNILNTDNQVGVGSRSDYQGQGASSRSSKITGQMTAKITSVLPSGNYMIAGTSYIAVNEEKQLIEVTGEVRPDDITSDNTVLSSRIANPKIKFTGTGPASETAKPGLLTRVLSWLGLF